MSPIDSVGLFPAEHRLFRSSYVVLSGLFMLCIIIQIFFAGSAIFVDSSSWH
jgi:hypothetical protein